MQRQRLQDPPDRLHQGAQQSRRLAPQLHKEPGVLASRGRAQRTPLLQRGPDGERGRGEQREKPGHGHPSGNDPIVEITIASMAFACTPGTGR